MQKINQEVWFNLFALDFNFLNFSEVLERPQFPTSFKLISHCLKVASTSCDLSTVCGVVFKVLQGGNMFSAQNHIHTQTSCHLVNLNFSRTFSTSCQKLQVIVSYTHLISLHMLLTLSLFSLCYLCSILQSSSDIKSLQIYISYEKQLSK